MAPSSYLHLLLRGMGIVLLDAIGERGQRSKGKEHPVQIYVPRSILGEGDSANRKKGRGRWFSDDIQSVRGRAQNT